MNPFVSICIPAFKRVEYLTCLLESISVQSYKDFEVIVTDDSPGDEVRGLCDQYKNRFALHYFKNQKALGTPENWNESIRRSTGKWIKMMHDDDWFTDAVSLLKFAHEAIKYPDSSFIFSGCYNVDINTGNKKRFVISGPELKRLKRSPLYLFKKNFIGHPSTTLIKNDNSLVYNKNLKWVVDFEFYMRYLNQNDGLVAIREPLVNIGLNEFQVTKKSFGNPAIEVPEIIYLYHTLPKGSLKNIFVYDYYWRFIRNLLIRNTDDIKKYTGDDPKTPAVIEKMIHFQSKFPVALLRNGFVSKPLMFLSYLTKHYTL